MIYQVSALDLTPLLLTHLCEEGVSIFVDYISGLIKMSVVQEHASLKRDHDSFDFDSLVDLEKPFTVPTNLSQTYTSQIEDRDVDSGESSTPAAIVSVRTRKLDPNQSGSTSLTDAGCMSSVKRKSPIPHSELISPLPQQASALPSAFAVLNGSAPPPTKKPKLSFTDTEAEKDAKKIAKGIKDHELAQERAAKQQERQAQAEEKARQNTEKTAERRQKEAEREQKRLALEAKKAARAERKRKKEEEKSMKEEEKRRKEEEKRRKEEEKRRKEEEKLEKQRAQQEKQNKDGKQKPLTSFFLTSTGANLNVLAPGRSESPAPNSCLLTAVANPATSPPKKLEKIAYDNIFSDFYLFQDVTMAPTNRFERDDQASLVLHSTIDSYILGDRSPHRQRGFDAIELFQLSGHANISRGKRCMPIREIMAEMSGKSARPIDLTTDSQNTQIKRANNLLRTVPLKFLKFQEDVRPPYRGTYTRRPVNGMARLARHPLRRDLPDTNYDYDSEAEWVEDEDAENLDSEGDDDEDVAEDGEDMEGFLDDENDDHANSMRLIVQGDLEPISSGLCWEDYRKRSPKVKMMPYRMEFVLG